ncbi:MAG: epoxyqueuosine reductase QueH [Firmicutes bacterium]|nr:epoxyqueuosine reductase QueH [Bacillota bacterium]
MMKTNYNVLMKDIIAKIEEGRVPSILLHSCCGPCSTEVIARLTKYFDITILYYNPNIEPKAEYEKRKQEQIRFINEFKPINKLEYMDCDYDNDAFLKMAQGLETEPEGGTRCHRCYELRLMKTAQLGKENNFDYFGTTLTVSPYKNSEVINQLGENIANKLGIKYLYSDFKKEDGYKKSIEYSKQYKLYRQNFCGCHFSRVIGIEE